jgi:hypothetical protein
VYEREMDVFFSDPEGCWCPYCLPDQIRRGEVVLVNPKRTEQLLAELEADERARSFAL